MTCFLWPAQSIGSLTEPLSQFIDLFANKFVSGLPSFLGDTADILNTIKQLKYEQADTRLTFDVQSLCTCIPNEIGLDALIQYLNKHPGGILPPNDFLFTLSEIILTINFFRFLDSYLQSRGAAMGSAFAPSYACLVMGQWEEKYIHYPL